MTKEDWLKEAMEVLAQKGSARLRVDTLAATLGVTKGSFYWHFKDRNEFAKSLIKYWFQVFTEQVIEENKAIGGSAEERLLGLMQTLTSERTGRFDVAVRAWAEREIDLKELMRMADQERLRYLRSLFSEMGFQGSELEMRSEIFVVYYSFSEAVSSIGKQSKKKREELLKARHALLTRR